MAERPPETRKVTGSDPVPTTMKPTIRATVAVFASVMLLLSCGGADNKLTHGRVVDKSYDDPDSWTTLTCASYNSKGICTVHVPVLHTEEAHWKLRIRGVDGKEDLVEWHEVDQVDYHEHNIGDLWSK